MRHFRWHRDVLTLRCSIQINAWTSRIIGVHDSQLNMTIAAPAREGAANSALIEQLAREFGVAKSRITLQKGNASRHSGCFGGADQVARDNECTAAGVNMTATLRRQQRDFRLHPLDSR